MAEDSHVTGFLTSTRDELTKREIIVQHNKFIWDNDLPSNLLVMDRKPQSQLTNDIKELIDDNNNNKNDNNTNNKIKHNDTENNNNNKNITCNTKTNMKHNNNSNIKKRVTCAAISDFPSNAFGKATESTKQHIMQEHSVSRHNRSL